MEIVNDWPPNINDIAKVIGNIRGLNPVFTYGDILYNPMGDDISPDLMAHEETHARQQNAYGVQDWWARYLVDTAFRLTQEIEAYQIQYKSVKDKPRDWRRRFLTAISKDLSSQLYGKIIKAKTAKELINA